jgi:ABC-type hemin transport system substrate-binding protein
MSRAWVVLQELFQAALLVASADAPDGGSVALQAVGEIAHTPAGGNGQDDPGMLHLGPRQAAVMGDELQDGPIGGRDG